MRLWDWTRNVVDESDYGPKVILEATEHASGKPTLHSLFALVESQRTKWQVPSETEVLWDTDR